MDSNNLIEGSFTIETLDSDLHAMANQLLAKHELTLQRANQTLARQIIKAANNDVAVAATQTVQGRIESIERMLYDLTKEIVRDAISNMHGPRPPKPTPQEIPPRLGEIYPQVKGLAKIFKNKRRAAIAIAGEENQRRYDDWARSKARIEKQNERKQKAFEEQTSQWEEDGKQLLRELDEIDEAVESFFDEVLEALPVPAFSLPLVDFEYNRASKMLVLDYTLPNQEQVGTIREVKYVQSRDVFEPKFLSKTAANKLFEDTLYRISLRTLQLIFLADVRDVVELGVFNGYVEAVDPATGQDIRPCIMSIQARKSEILSLNLSSVDPKVCFKALKGISAAKLVSVVPVKPIITISRDDDRFVEGYDVSQDIDESFNLAAMDWEDFEHLIREVFQQEFSAGGGEVKVTRASRDGGIDAVAFDPDPIRGGKTVIQAKRYTRTVGVSAVRDLYGAVMNEGAARGILVTTSDYGPDAHSFAKGKPIVLLSGNHLLHLLEKHGHKAKIDLIEAKRLQAEER